MKIRQPLLTLMLACLFSFMLSLPGLAKDEEEPDLSAYIDKAAEKAAEDAMKAAEKAAEDAARAAEDAAEKAAEDAAKAAEKAAEEAAEDATRAAEKAAEDAAEDAAKAAEDAAEEAAKDAARAAEEAAEEAAEQAEDAIEEAGDLARDLARAEEDAFEDRMDALEKRRHEHEDSEREHEDDGHRSRNRNRNRSGSDDARRDKRTHSDDHSSGRPRISNAGRAITAQLERDLRGNEIVRNEWLYAVPINKAAGLEKSLGKGAVTRSYPGLGIALVKQRADSHRQQASQKSSEQVGVSEAVSDHNHVYYGVAGLVSETDRGVLPGDLSQWPPHYRQASPVIGVIDTALPSAYQSFRKDQLYQRSFVNEGIRQPTNHGLAVVSILAANSKLYKGLLPEANIYLATVFEQDDTGVTRTSTERLVEALNWMVEMNIPVVNMSLTGPANQILEDAIDQAYARGTTVVSAVGNGGPHAAPMFPSAYDKVVAVTAVSASKSVYRLANRGKHVDFAAPGVDILHPDDTGKALTSSSGTSMAAPFVAGLLAVRCEEAGESTCPVQSILHELKAKAEDLGAPGYDAVYGHGLVIR